MLGWLQRFFSVVVAIVAPLTFALAVFQSVFLMACYTSLS
jgi:hypothetical protein